MGVATIISLFILYKTLVNHVKISLIPLVASIFLLSLLIILTQFKIISFYPLDNLFSLFLIILPVTFYLLLQTLNFGRKNPKLAFACFSPFIINLFALTIISFHLLTDQKITLLPLFAGWAVLLEIYKNFVSLVLGVGPTNFIYAFNSNRYSFHSRRYGQKNGANCEEAEHDSF